MISEITEIYVKQYKYYDEILNILKVLDTDEFSSSKYEKELENIDYLLDKIKSFNERADQLKNIYILKHNLEDFSSSEIQKLEKKEEFETLKTAVDNLSYKILAVRNLHDKLIKRLNSEMAAYRKLLGDNNLGRDLSKAYKKDVNAQSGHIDSKK